MDKLEEHIRQNRDDLDRYSPQSGIWKKIRKQLNNNTSMTKQWLTIAAIIVVILGTALVFFKPEFRWSGSNHKDYEDQFTLLDPQLKETETYYKNLVNSLYSEVTPLLTNNPEIKNELNTDLSHLDSICVDLKKDLKDNISNEEVIGAMIRNYRIKISILEEMLTLLKTNENNPKKEKDHEL